MMPRASKHSVLCFLHSMAKVGRVLPGHTSSSLGIAWTSLYFSQSTIKAFSSQVTVYPCTGTV